MEDLTNAISVLTEETRFLALGNDHIVEFPFWDRICKLYIPFAQTDLIQKSILKHRTFYEHYLLLKVRPYIKPLSTVADVGANIGNHTVFFGVVCDAIKVYAFEPQNVAHSILVRNVEINLLSSKVDVHRVAIGDQDGSLSLTRFTQTNMGGSQFGASEAVEDYPVKRLDSIGIDKLDFMKIDVEGSQCMALDGAVETIQRCRPTIWAEIREGEESAFETFKVLGYRRFDTLGKTDYLFFPH